MSQEEGYVPEDDIDDNASQDGEAVEQERKRPGRKKKTISLCQLCEGDLAGDRPYYQRYRICPTCSTLPSVEINGRPHRFCQQCGRFQEVELFQGTMRTCRERLDKHAARRRKSSNNIGYRNDSGYNYRPHYGHDDYGYHGGPYMPHPHHMQNLYWMPPPPPPPMQAQPIPLIASALARPRPVRAPHSWGTEPQYDHTQHHHPQQQEQQQGWDLHSHVSQLLNQIARGQDTGGMPHNPAFDHPAAYNHAGHYPLNPHAMGAGPLDSAPPQGAVYNQHRPAQSMQLPQPASSFPPAAAYSMDRTVGNGEDRLGRGFMPPAPRVGPVGGIKAEDGRQGQGGLPLTSVVQLLQNVTAPQQQLQQQQAQQTEHDATLAKLAMLQSNPEVKALLAQLSAHLDEAGHPTAVRTAQESGSAGVSMMQAQQEQQQPDGMVHVHRQQSQSPEKISPPAQYPQQQQQAVNPSPPPSALAPVPVGNDDTTDSSALLQLLHRMFNANRQQ